MASDAPHPAKGRVAGSAVTLVVAALVEEAAGGAGAACAPPRGPRRVFLARRSAAAGHGGLWELPGGKVEPGESPAQALAREIGEELGSALEILGPERRYEQRVGGRDFIFLVFPSRFLGEPSKLAAHDEWAYFEAGQLASLELAPLDPPALRDWAARPGLP